MARSARDPTSPPFASERECKGYKKSKGEELTFEDFEELAGGGVKSQRQVQFLCPKMNHVSMTELLSKDSSGIKITPIYA